MKADTTKIFDWWAQLQPDKADDRATLARLRRAGTVAQLCLLPETFAFCRRVGVPRHALESHALLAGVLATVRTNVSSRFARQLGSPMDQPVMSSLRFQRLIEAVTPDEKLTAFRRAIQLNDRTGNVQDIAKSLLNWTPETQQSWLYDYYHTDNPDIEKDPAA